MKYEEYLNNESSNKYHVKKIYARMEDNFHLTNKKGLLINMQDYYKLRGKCVFESKVFPYTYLLKNG